tara:strand:- start:519 stop:881 length:363 start_codon:yes stop_codon:yes gene_type:complete
MSESTYIYPTGTYPARGITAAGAPMPKANPVYMGTHTTISTSAYERVCEEAEIECATGVRVKNYGDTNSCQIRYALTLPGASEVGFILGPGEEVFIESESSRHVWAKSISGTTNVTFIVS